MKKLTKVQATKLDALQKFIPWYEKEYGSTVYMNECEVTFGWTLHKIYRNATGIYIVVDGMNSKRKTERIEANEITKIYSAVRRGEGDSFRIFLTEVMSIFPND